MLATIGCGGESNGEPSHQTDGSGGSTTETGGASGHAGTAGSAGVSGSAGSAGTPQANGPPADFLEPTSDDYATFQFKGTINSQEVVDNDYSNILPGIGTLDVSILDREISFTDADTLFAEEYTFTNEAKRVVLIQAEKFDPASTSNQGKLTYALIYLSTEPLMSLAPSESIVEEGLAGDIADLDYAVRKDGTLLRKTCRVGLMTEGSKVFVDHGDNQTYAAGEAIKVWGNTVLLADPQAISDATGWAISYDGQVCRCSIEEQDFPCAEWDERVADPGDDLSCGMPDGFLTADGDTYASFRSRGTISSIDTYDPAFVEGTVKVGGDESPLDVGYIVGVSDPGGHYAEVGAYYNIVQGTDAGSYDMVRLILMTSRLQEAKDAGEANIGLDDPYGMFGMISHVDWYEDGHVPAYRFCVLAVARFADAPGRLYGCFDNNETFDVGETLETAMVFPAYTDVTSAEVGLELDEDGCACFDANDQPMPCE